MIRDSDPDAEMVPHRHRACISTDFYYLSAKSVHSIVAVVLVIDIIQNFVENIVENFRGENVIENLFSLQRRRSVSKKARWRLE